MSTFATISSKREKWVMDRLQAKGKRKETKMLVPKPVTLASNEFQKKEKKNETPVTRKYYTRD